VETRGAPFAPTDCALLVAHVLEDLRSIIEEADADVRCDPLPTLPADRGQLARVFQNLIANAIKFRREDVTPRVHISAEREGNVWTFAVADNGIGLDPVQAERIFQIFQRLYTDEEYPGLGIGLALCKRIVERHGGRIWMDSEPGAGSTFYFTLPAETETS
jgi:light-regulated signal transduction histidine kinase (bacteriophytochrome)